MAEIVVVHGLTAESRGTTFQHTLSFGSYSFGHKVHYVNIFGLIPTELRPELIILTYEFLALRNLPIWKTLTQRIKPLLSQARTVIAMPQDDYTRCAVLDDFFQVFKVDAVFTPITKDLEVLYPRSVASGIRFFEAFTGYFDEKDRQKLSGYSKPLAERTIDVGQRVRLLSPQFGEIASRKGTIALKFARYAELHGFNCDVSVRDEDVITGDKWYEFLGNSRFTISRKGGASLADPYGKIGDRIRRIQSRNPEASQETLEKAIPSKMGYKGDFSAISPRLFEAAALGVCQILETDTYLDGLEPWVHYLPLDSDFSNIESVFKAMKDLDLCEEVVLNSQKVLLKEGAYTYAELVKRILLTAGISPSLDLNCLVQDSSITLFSGQISNEQIQWIQRYVARAIINRECKKVKSYLSEGKFLKFAAEDVDRARFAIENAILISDWIDKCMKNELLLESLLVHWVPAGR